MNRLRLTPRGSTQAVGPGTLPLVMIRPSPGWVPLDLKALSDYKELLYFLAWRDIKVRYKQTVLGAAWAIIQPFFTMVVFSIFFGRLAKIPSDGLPYPIFAYCALLPWQLFAHALGESSNSLVANQNLITKVYFPRLVIPSSAVTGRASPPGSRRGALRRTRTGPQRISQPSTSASAVAPGARGHVQTTSCTAAPLSWSTTSTRPLACSTVTARR